MVTRRSYAVPTGLEWIPYWTKLVEVAWFAPQVMAYRMAGMWSGSGTAKGRRENTRMVQEKSEAFAEALLAVWTGRPCLAARTFEQALAPVHRRVVANNRRLSRR